MVVPEWSEIKFIERVTVFRCVSVSSITRPVPRATATFPAASAYPGCASQRIAGQHPDPSGSLQGLERGPSRQAIQSRLLQSYPQSSNSGRLRWNCTTLAEAIGQPLEPGCAAEFVSYVRNLAIRDTGWVDLYVLPPEKRRGYLLWDVPDFGGT